MRDLIQIVEGISASTINEVAYKAFHGTSARFRAFKEQKPRHIASYRLGFYFADNPRYAETNAGQ